MSHLGLITLMLTVLLLDSSNSSDVIVLEDINDNNNHTHVNNYNNGRNAYNYYNNNNEDNINVNSNNNNNFVSYDIGRNCSNMDGHCRLRTFRDDEKNGGKVHIEFSCSCYPEETDVSASLNDLMSRLCPLVPIKAQSVVDYSTLNITRCNTSEPLPVELLTVLRRSRHLTVWIQDSSSVRLPVLATDQLQPYIDTIDLTVIDSKVSGIGRGLVSGAKWLRASVHGSQVGVIGSNAFAHYTAQDADVTIDIKHSEVTKFAKNAIQLPTSGRLTVDGVRLSVLDGGAVSGAGEISFKNSVIGLISKRAFNIAQLYKLEISNCTVAEVEAAAVVSEQSTRSRGSNNVAAATGLSTTDSNTRRCHVIVNNTKLIRMMSSSFRGVCQAAQLTWHTNVLIDVMGGPLKLQSHDCLLAPSSFLSPTFLKCNDCSIYEDFTDEMCPVYSLSSWCSVCQHGTTTCPPQSVQDFLTNECPRGGNTARHINATCRADRQARQLQLTSHSSSSSRDINCNNIIVLLSLALIGFIVNLA